MTWQTDAKHYQFWVDAVDPNGRFSSTKVTPGEYSLYALADGVLGEFAKADVSVGEGESVELGELHWTPVRHGRQLWEVGVPNRTATEFAGAERFFEPGITREYARLFPDDVTFTIGESREAEDWCFAHVPHATGADSGNGRATPYTIRFELDQALSGTAVLRLAFSGTGTRVIDVAVNGESAGQVDPGFGDGVLSRHQIQGIWHQREFRFDTALLRPGENSLTLIVPEGALTAGVVYDYLRLELDD
jgi:rhamnogalacturonan endolyase